MVGKGQRLTTKDEEEIGLPARRFLTDNNASFVILVDDLEEDRRGSVDQVFARYRTVLNEVLARPDLQKRASVHFFVNMLEAYYFAHSDAVNTAAGANVLVHDHADDVENIGHPKNELKRIWPTFDEIIHGEQIVQSLDMDHILNNPEHCQWLRSLFAWSVDKLDTEDAIWNDVLKDMFQLPTGICAPLTRDQ